MSFSATILKDSLFPNKVRVTTVKLTFPRDILAEFNTHRMISKNVASSRAQPVNKVSDKIVKDPFIPEFSKNEKGMQGYTYLSEDEQAKAKEVWLGVLEHVLNGVSVLSQKDTLNIHKQYVNRLLEPWMWTTVIATATDWNNMFALRTHPAAQPSFQKIANLFYDEYHSNKPKVISHTYSDISQSWHLPYYDGSEEDENQRSKLTYKDVIDYLVDRLGDEFESNLNKVYPENRFNTRFWQDVCVGRIAKVSYENLVTGKIDLLNDIRLSVQLSMSEPGHWSPFEHICRMAHPSEQVYKIGQLKYDKEKGIVPCYNEVGYCGNLKGAFQYRKEFKNENIMEFIKC